MKILMYTVGGIAVLCAFCVTAFFLYSSVVSRQSLQDLKVKEAGVEGHTVVTIDGRLIGGMMAVRSTEQRRKGRCIVLLVRSGITRPGLRDATFHYDIPVPSGVDEISFGNTESVAWKRKQ